MDRGVDQASLNTQVPPLPVDQDILLSSFRLRVASCWSAPGRGGCWERLLWVRSTHSCRHVWDVAQKRGLSACWCVEHKIWTLEHACAPSVAPGTTGASKLGELDGIAPAASHAAVTAGRRPRAGGQAVGVGGPGGAGAGAQPQLSYFKLPAVLRWRLPASGAESRSSSLIAAAPVACQGPRQAAGSAIWVPVIGGAGRGEQVGDEHPGDGGGQAQRCQGAGARSHVRAL